MIQGNVKVTKIYSNGTAETVFDDSNIVTDGLGYSLVNILTNNGSTNIEDHQIAYFQLGNSKQDLSSVNFFVKNNFYALSSAFEETDYGLESPLLLYTNPQIRVQNDFDESENLVYFLSSGVFARLSENISTASYENTDVIKHRITLDENTANGKTIKELGLFLRNPDGAKGSDRTILAAYRALEKEIVKSPQFSINIDWSFSIGAENSVATPGKNFSYIVQILSGTGGGLETGTDFDEYFIVNTPESYEVYPDGTPLVIGCHGFDIVALGASGTSINDLVNSGDMSGILVEKILNNNFFGIHPCLGKNGTVASAFPPGSDIDAGNKALNYGLWNEDVGLRHVKLAVSWMKNQYPINDNKIYMWGWSNGGVAPITYASKLLDPTKDFMVAGVVSETPDGLNYDYLFRESTAGRKNRLRFWTSGQGRISYIPSAETNNNYQGPNWSLVSALDVNAACAKDGACTTSSFMPEFHKNSAFVFLHDTSDVSAGLSIAKNIRHIPIALSHGSDDYDGGNDAFLAGIDVFDKWATSAARGFPGSGLDHPNYLFQLRDLDDHDGHNFDHMGGMNVNTGKSYFDGAWDHVSANTLTFPESGEYCIYNSQRIFNVQASPSAVEWDQSNCGAANFYFENKDREDVTLAPVFSSTLSSMNNVASFQHYGIGDDINNLTRVKKLKTNRRVTLHGYPDPPSKVERNGAQFRSASPINGGPTAPNYLIGATRGDPYDFGSPNSSPAGQAGNWIIRDEVGCTLQNCTNIRVSNNGFTLFPQQLDPYNGQEWDYLFKNNVSLTGFADNNIVGKVNVGSIVGRTFTFSVYFQLIDLASATVNLALYSNSTGNYGEGGNAISTAGIVHTTATLDTNTVLTVGGATQGFNDWQRVSHTVTFPDNGTDQGEILNPVIFFGSIDDVTTFPQFKYVAISHAKLEEGDTATSFIDDPATANWEHNPAEGTLLLQNPVSENLTWEITP